MIFAYCLLALFVGSQAMIKKIAPANRYTKWLDRDNPSKLGDIEFVNAFTPRPCGGKAIRIEVRVKGDRTVIISSTKLIRFGPQFGLVCRNSDQPNKKCLDYSVQYLIPKISRKFDRDDPTGTGDWELKKRLKNSGRINGNFIYWYANKNNYGLSDEFLLVGPRLGLICLRKAQPDKTCRDYQVRFLCPNKFVPLKSGTRGVALAGEKPEDPEAGGKLPPETEFVEEKT